MKKNKGQYLGIMIGVAIVVIMWVALWWIFFGRFGGTPELKFNPDKHVCEEWRCLDCGAGGCIDDGCYVEYCESWRSKTPCEINFDEENCVCDEWEDPIIKATVCWTDCEEQYGYCWDMKDRLSIVEPIYDTKSKEKRPECKGGHGGITIPENLTCLKPREKNPCELGDEDYVWDYDCSKVQMCKIHDEWIPLNKGTTNITEYNLVRETCCQEICRQKTIYDYSCEELKRALLLTQGCNIYCTERNCFVYENNCNWCWSFKQRGYVFNIMIEKGCEIG